MNSNNKKPQQIMLKLKSQQTTDFLLNYALYIILGILILAVILYEPSFVSVTNFTNILTQASTRAILAVGVAALIVLRGTDLSAGRILGITAAISASFLQRIDYGAIMYPDVCILPVVVPLLAALVVSAAFGALNGFGVAKLQMHAFIATLGTQLIAFGLLQTYIDRPPLGAQPISTLDTRYLELVNGAVTIGDIRIPYLIFYAAIM